ncbi:MAG: hypothetical protein QXI33_03250 [Candidatus Pacearchaeota archaeon]
MNASIFYNAENIAYLVIPSVFSFMLNNPNKLEKEVNKYNKKIYPIHPLCDPSIEHNNTGKRLDLKA